jgi:serine/threonine protein kinase
MCAFNIKRIGGRHRSHKAADFSGHSRSSRSFRLRNFPPVPFEAPPNIITIHEIGEVDHTHYIVTEYVEGETLRQRLVNAPEKQLKLAEALDVAAQIAAALSAAHAAGITHRDIKPENVMVRPDGYVKVLDFGLAKLIEPSSPAIDTQGPAVDAGGTRSGVVVGTPRYMSPAQARGEKVDARTDIFSLGVMLYEMIAGRPPFAGPTTSDLIAAILKDEPQPLTSHAPAAPPELERIAAKALRKNRQERYQNAHALLADLKQLQRDLEFTPEERKRSGQATARREPEQTPPRHKCRAGRTRHCRNCRVVLLQSFPRPDRQGHDSAGRVREQNRRRGLGRLPAGQDRCGARTQARKRARLASECRARARALRCHKSS